MSMWIAIGIAFVFWWLGFLTASLMAASRDTDKRFKEDEHSD